MPIETVKCKECGSADVTEFKPGSYACGHCEAVFKFAGSAASPAGCEVDGCGVLAIGRCADCRGAFCATHQGWADAPRFPYIDLCAPCLTRRAEVVRQQWQPPAEPPAPQPTLELLRRATEAYKAWTADPSPENSRRLQKGDGRGASTSTAALALRR